MLDVKEAATCVLARRVVLMSRSEKQAEAATVSAAVAAAATQGPTQSQAPPRVGSCM